MLNQFYVACVTASTIRIQEGDGIWPLENENVEHRKNPINRKTNMYLEWDFTAIVYYEHIDFDRTFF